MPSEHPGEASAITLLIACLFFGVITLSTFSSKFAVVTGSMNPYNYSTMDLPLHKYMRKDHHPADASIIQKIQEDPETSRQILKAIFDSTKSSIFLIAPDYRILFFNKWASEGCKYLYGMEVSIGDSILDYRDKNDEAAGRDFKEDFQRAILTKNLVVREREVHHPDTSFWVQLEHTPVYDDHKLIGVLLNVLNITDRRKVEIQNEHQENQLIRIAWTQSHETRQPVATMLGLINILDRKNLSADNLEIVTLLEGTALKLEKIIQQTVIMANNVKSK